MRRRRLNSSLVRAYFLCVTLSHLHLCWAMSAVNSQALTVIEKGTCWEKPRLAQYRSYLLGMKETYSARCERNFNMIVKHACVCCAPCHVQGNAKMNCSLVTRSAEPAAILIHVRLQRGSSITRRTSGLEQIQARPGEKIRSEESTGDERSPTFSLIVSQNLFLCLTLSNSWLF